MTTKSSNMLQKAAKDRKRRLFDHKMLGIYAVFSVVSMLVCAYGHAAVSSDLLISGEATVKATNAFQVTYMQEMTPEICAQADPLTTAQLIDQRDDKTYWVTKLPDGQCWMTQNLDYDGGGTKYTNSSDISRWIHESEGLTPAQYFYTNDNREGHESNGSYYSHAAALSVCPAGWRLPISGAGGDYDNLLGGDKVGSSLNEKLQNVQQEPYYFRMSGWMYNNGLNIFGTFGGYASTRLDGEVVPYSFTFSQQHGFWTYTDEAYAAGISVRCVAGEPTEEPEDLMVVTNMQDFTPTMCSKSVIGMTKRLKDSRDGHRYWVTKLKDGNCWMTQNLDYNGGGTRYTENTVGSWKMTGAPSQHYYTGDWENGRTSLGSYYSFTAAQTVCPSGWRLPTTGADGETAKLWSGISSIKTLQSDPYYFVAGGYVSDDGIRQSGAQAYWWGQQGINGEYGLMAYVIPNQLYPNTEDSPYFGESVRCLIPGN